MFRIPYSFTNYDTPEVHAALKATLAKNRYHIHQEYLEVINQRMPHMTSLLSR
jgi:hypothetical protein